MRSEARAEQLGVLIDLVPNHMGIDDPGNLWWQDVLENGASSPQASYFDIDWTPPKAALQGKVLLAVLGDTFGKVLEQQQLQSDLSRPCVSHPLPRAAVAYGPSHLGSFAQASGRTSVARARRRRATADGIGKRRDGA